MTAMAGQGTVCKGVKEVGADESKGKRAKTICVRPGRSGWCLYGAGAGNGLQHAVRDAGEAFPGI